MKRNSHLRGIVVAADTQEQAMDHFRAVASGNYKVFESKDGEYAVATSNTSELHILDPINGEEMVAVPEDEKHDMVATASADEDMDAFYIACANGCGSHVIASEEDLLQQCPSCASALPKLEDADLKTNTQPKEILLAVASSRKEAAKVYRALASGECETFHTLCDDDVMVISNQPLKFDIYKGTAASKPVEDFTPTLAVASSENEDGEKKLQVHYLCTASDSGEQLHILASDQSPVFCPETSVGLVDPSDVLSEQERAVASSDFDDEDEEDYDDEDESEEDDSEEDDEDESDDEEDEDEEEDDEDDEDLSLSLASDKPVKKGGVRRKAKPEVATASAAKPEVSAPVSINASFVAYASSEMKDESVEVAYAGTIKGEPTWIAFHDGIPFAKAVASSAENKAEFASANFGRAFKAIAADEGVTAAMSQLKFEEIKPQINVDQLVATQIETQVEARAAELASAASRDTSEMAARFEAALATAARGINTGFFKDVQNPIRLALASSLDDMGIQGGEELLKNAFAAHSDVYNQRMIAKASELMKYDLEVQNQMAQAVSEVQEQNVATAASLSVGRPVNQTSKSGVNFPVEKELATASADVPNSFQSKLKGLRLGR